MAHFAAQVAPAGIQRLGRDDLARADLLEYGIRMREGPVIGVGDGWLRLRSRDARGH